MKKLILSIVIILVELAAAGQNIHYYNPTPTVSQEKQGTTTLNIGYNRQRLVGEMSVNVTNHFILSGAYSGFSKSSPSFMSPSVNRLNENLRVGSVHASYIYKINGDKLAVEGQLGYSGTRYNYSDLPTTEPDAVHVYREKVSFDEKALHSSVLLHFYKGKSDIYVGLRHVESKYGDLTISNSIYDDGVDVSNMRSAGDGLVLGCVYTYKKLSIHAQLGILSSPPIKLEQEETAYGWWLFGTRTYTNTTIYSGTDFTSMIKLGYTLN